MINKQSLWFLTLFSIILVLSVYYIAMPNNTLATLSELNNNSDILITQTDPLLALRVENDEELETTMNELQSILLNENSSLEERNTAYETIQNLNSNKGKENNIEKIISDKFGYKSFVKIKNDSISITISNKTHDTKLANDIIRTIQNEYNNKMYITVKFQ
ncbi:MAG: SpoIIIAH-like family protein [Bacilli bacterium]|nr:SpoIIIAH-like family protein [Bacilli bacterium]